MEMKELYTSPELEILCFAPMQGIATDWPQTFDLTQRGTSDNVSIEESRPGDHDVTIQPSEGM